MTITSVIPRHGASLARMTLIPALSAADRVVWTAAREWPLLGAVLALGALVAFGSRVSLGELDPMLVVGYAAGLVLTRAAASSVRRAVVRLEIVCVRR